MNYILYIPFVVALIVLVRKKLITRDVFMLIIGIIMFSTASEELNAMGYIRDLGSDELIRDYELYSRGPWFRLFLGAILMAVQTFSIAFKQHNKSGKDQ
jgi:hypothetical protein